MRLKEGQGPESEQNKLRSNAENELYKGLQNIRQSTTEIRDILSILKPLLVSHLSVCCKSTTEIGDRHTDDPETTAVESCLSVVISTQR